MASLLKKMKQTRGPDGQLITTPISDLTEDLDAKPRTALGAQMVGANIDQQKMMGTPAQKAAARQAEVETLSEARRRAAQTQPQSAEQAQTESLTDSLGGLGAKVQSYIEQAAAGLADITVPQPNVEGLSEEQAALLRQVSDSPSPETLQQLQQSLGLDEAGLQAELQSRLSPDVAGQLTEAVSQISTPLAGQLLQPEELAEVSQILGQDVSGFTPEQLEQAVEQYEAQEFEQVNILREQATNPNLTAADREAARAQLRDMGAVGILTNQEELQAIQTEIDEGKTVEVGGRSWAIDDILGDEGLSSIIDTYLNDQDFALEMNRTDPAFADWITRNRNALEAMSLETSVIADPLSTYREMRKEEQAAKSKINLSDEVIRDIIGDTPLLESDLWQSFNDADPETRSRWTSSVSQVKQAEGLGDLIGVVTPAGTSLQEMLNNHLDGDRARGEQTDESREFTRLFDRDGDGRVDSFEEVQERLMDRLRETGGRGTFEDVAMPEAPDVETLIRHGRMSRAIEESRMDRYLPHPPMEEALRQDSPEASQTGANLLNDITQLNEFLTRVEEEIPREEWDVDIRERMQQVEDAVDEKHRIVERLTDKITEEERYDYFLGHPTIEELRGEDPDEVTEALLNDIRHLEKWRSLVDPLVTTKAVRDQIDQANVAIQEKYDIINQLRPTLFGTASTAEPFDDSPEARAKIQEQQEQFLSASPFPTF